MNENDKGLIRKELIDAVARLDNCTSILQGVIGQPILNDLGFVSDTLQIINKLIFFEEKEISHSKNRVNKIVQRYTLGLEELKRITDGAHSDPRAVVSSLIESILDLSKPLVVMKNGIWVDACPAIDKE
jgi:hypothetical protein